MKNYINLFIFLLVIVLPGLSSCTNVKKSHKELNFSRNNEEVKRLNSVWYCLDKVGFAGSRPYFTIVSDVALDKDNGFCISLLSRKIRSINSQKKIPFNLTKIHDPYDLANKIKSSTRKKTVISQYIDRDGTRRIRLTVYKTPDIHTIFDFISKHDMALYKKKRCLFKPKKFMPT